MEWISVEDRLPDTGDYVLTANPYKFVFSGGCVMKAYIYMDDSCDHEGWYNEDTGDMVEGVTHWVSLPEPPKD